MNSVRQRLLAALAEMSELHPDMRLGQTICNMTDRAKEPTSAVHAAAAIWDIEDEELLASLEEFIANRRSQLLP